jgi:hypothetical protein
MSYQQPDTLSMFFAVLKFIMDTGSVIIASLLLYQYSFTLFLFWAIVYVIVTAVMVKEVMDE